ncbi:MAG: hypothetical protein NVS1B13_00150 [Flavisolibacter sp.]
MNTFKLLSFSATLALGLTACNNSATNTSASDSTSHDSTTVSTTTATTSSSQYSALADSVEKNSQSGYYLNAKTGKALRVKVDRSTGKMADAESNMPLNRYVDKRTWRVYGGNNWDSIGSAKMQGEKLMYQDQNGQWVNYDKKWKEEDMKSDMSSGSSTNNMTDSSMNKTNNTATDNTSNGKMSTEHSKVKVRDHGNKIKIKEKDNP